MANPRQLDKRRKSIRNMRKITRTMELIATARFKQAMDRASAATSYANQISKLVADLAQAGLEVSHPLLEGREETRRATVLVLTANRGFCGGFVGNLVRAGATRLKELRETVPEVTLEVSGKKGIGAFEVRKLPPDVAYKQFDAIATRYLEEYISGKLDRLDVVYTRFETPARQSVAIETLLPLGSLAVETPGEEASTARTNYEFLPSPESILEEVVPTSFKVKLFKCFLDSAVSEQIARMVAMKAATENADELIKQLSMQYNRARQGRITNELMDLIGGVNAIS